MARSHRAQRRAGHHGCRIATAANIAWLKEEEYRTLVASRERTRQFDHEHALDTLTASGETVR